MRSTLMEYFPAAVEAFERSNASCACGFLPRALNESAMSCQASDCVRSSPTDIDKALRPMLSACGKFAWSMRSRPISIHSSGLLGSMRMARSIEMVAPGKSPRLRCD